MYLTVEGIRAASATSRWQADQVNIIYYRRPAASPYCLPHRPLQQGDGIIWRLLFSTCQTPKIPRGYVAVQFLARNLAITFPIQLWNRAPTRDPSSRHSLHPNYALCPLLPLTLLCLRLACFCRAKTCQEENTLFSLLSRLQNCQVEVRTAILSGQWISSNAHDATVGIRLPQHTPCWTIRGFILGLMQSEEGYHRTRIARRDGRYPSRGR